jgi:hypothetical protein
VIENNQLMAPFPLRVLQLNEAMGKSYAIG